MLRDNLLHFNQSFILSNSILFLSSALAFCDLLMAISFVSFYSTIICIYNKFKQITIKRDIIYVDDEY